MCSGRLFRPRAGPGPARVDVEAELGGDHDLVAHRLERLADQLLVVERAVDLGGVEERDAALHRRAKQRDHLGPGRRRAVGWLIPMQPKPMADTFEARGAGS